MAAARGENYVCNQMYINYYNGSKKQVLKHLRRFFNDGCVPDFFYWYIDFRNTLRLPDQNASNYSKFTWNLEHLLPNDALKEILESGKDKLNTEYITWWDNIIPFPAYENFVKGKMLDLRLALYHLPLVILWIPFDVAHLFIHKSL